MIKPNGNTPTFRVRLDGLLMSFCNLFSLQKDPNPFIPNVFSIWILFENASISNCISSPCTSVHFQNRSTFGQKVSPVFVVFYLSSKLYERKSPFLLSLSCSIIACTNGSEFSSTWSATNAGRVSLVTYFFFFFSSSSFFSLFCDNCSHGVTA